MVAILECSCGLEVVTNVVPIPESGETARCPVVVSVASHTQADRIAAAVPVDCRVPNRALSRPSTGAAPEDCVRPVTYSGRLAETALIQRGES